MTTPFSLLNVPKRATSEESGGAASRSQSFRARAGGGGAKGTSSDSFVAALLADAKSLQALSDEKRSTLRAELGERNLQEFYSLSQEPDPVLLSEGLLTLAHRLEGQDKLDWALKIYGAVQQLGQATASPTAGAQNFKSLQSVANKAEQRMKAAQGQGAAGARFEFLLNRFAKDATDYKTIVPMMAGSLVGQLAETAVMGRLAVTARSGWMVARWAPKLVAAASGFVPEFVTFGLLNREMVEGPKGNLADDLARSAVSIGALKLAGYFGNQAFLNLHGFNELNIPTRLTGLAKFNQFVIPQVAMFSGMMLSHQLEEKLGLRQKTDDATTVTDTLTSMVSMGVGAHLGHQVLGARFAKFQQGLGVRAGIYEEKLSEQPAKQSADTKAEAPFPLDAKVAGAGIGTALMLLPEMAHAAIPGIAHGDGSSLGIATLLASLGTLVLGMVRWKSSPPPGVNGSIYDTVNSFDYRAPSSETNRVYDPKLEKAGELDELVRLHQAVLAAGTKLLINPETPFEDIIAHLHGGQALITLGSYDAFYSKRWGPVDLRALAASDPLKYYPGNVRQAELFRDLSILLGQGHWPAYKLRSLLGPGADEYFQERHWNNLHIHWQHQLWLQHHIDFSNYQDDEGYARFAQEHFAGDPHAAWMAVRPLFESLRDMKAKTGWPMMKKTRLDREPELRRELVNGISRGHLVGEEGYDLFAATYFEGDARLAWNAARTLLTAEGFRRLQWLRSKTTNVFKQDEVRQILRSGIADGSLIQEWGYDQFAEQYFGGYSNSAWAAARGLLPAEEFAKLEWGIPKVTKVQEQQKIRDFLRHGLEAGHLVGEAGYDNFAREFFRGCSSTAWRAAKSLLDGESFAKLRWRPKLTYLHEEADLRSMLREGLRNGDWFGEKGLDLYAQQFWSGDPVRAWDVARSVLTEIEFLLLAWEHPDSDKEGLERTGGAGFTALGDYLLNQHTPPLEEEVVQRFLKLLAAKPRTLGKRLLRLIQSQRIPDLGLQILLQWFEKIIEEIPHIPRRAPEPESDKEKSDKPPAPPDSKPPASEPKPLDLSPEELEEIRKTLEAIKHDPHSEAEFLFELVQATVGENPGVQLLLAYLKEHLGRIPRAKKRAPSDPPSGSGGPRSPGDSPKPSAPESAEASGTELPPIESIDGTKAPDSTSGSEGTLLVGEPLRPEPVLAPIDPPTWAAIEIPKNILWKFPELELAMVEPPGAAFFQRFKNFLPEAKALCHLLSLWEWEVKGYRERPWAQEISGEWEQHLHAEGGTTSLPELLQNALAAHCAVRMEILTNLPPSLFIGLLPELRNGGPRLTGEEAVRAFLGHFFSRRVSEVFWNSWVNGLDELMRVYFLNEENIEMEQRPQVLEKLLHPLLQHYLTDREAILSAPVVPLEDIEKQYFLFGNVPDSVKEAVRREFPETELTLDHGYTGSLLPSDYRAQEIMRLLSRSCGANSYITFATSTRSLRPLMKTWMRTLKRRGFIRQAGAVEPYLAKIWSDKLLENYCELRPQFLEYLARSKEVGPDRLRAVFPGMQPSVEDAKPQEDPEQKKDSAPTGTVEPIPLDSDSLSDPAFWNAIEIPKDIIWTYPEIEIVGFSPAGMGDSLRHFASPEGKAVLAFMVLWSKFRQDLSPRAEKIITEMRAHLERTAARSVPMSELLKRFLASHQAIRRELMSQWGVDKVMGWLPELRNGGPVLKGGEAVNAFLGHFFSRQVSEAFWDSWMKHLDRLFGIHLKDGNISEDLQVQGEDLQVQAQQEVLRPLLEHYFDNREKILALPTVVLSDWEQQYYPIAEIPTEVRDEIKASFPETELSPEKDFVPGNSSIWPSQFRELKIMAGPLRLPSPEHRFVSNPKITKLPAFEKWISMAKRSQFVRQLGIMEPHLNQRWVRLGTEYYRGVRPHYLEHLARSKEIGVDRLLALFPQYAVNEVPSEFPEIAALREQGATHIPTLFRLLQGPLSPQLQTLVEKLLWNQNPLPTSASPQVIEQKSAEFGGRIRNFAQDHLMELLDIGDGKQSDLASQTAKLESQLAKDVEALWELQISGSNEKGLDNMRSLVTQARNAIGPSPGYLLRLGMPTTMERQAAVRQYLLPEDEALNLQEARSQGKGVMINSAQGEEYHEAKDILSLEELRDYYRLIYAHLLELPPLTQKLIFSAQTFFQLKTLHQAMFAEQGKAAGLILMGADPAWTRAVLAKRLLKIYQNHRGQILPLLDVTMGVSTLPEVDQFPTLFLDAAREALAQQLGGRTLQASSLRSFLREEGLSSKVYGLLMMAEWAKPGWLDQFAKETKIKQSSHYFEKYLKSLHRFYLEHRQKILPLLPDFAEGPEGGSGVPPPNGPPTGNPAPPRGHESHARPGSATGEANAVLEQEAAKPETSHAKPEEISAPPPAKNYSVLPIDLGPKSIQHDPLWEYFSAKSLPDALWAQWMQRFDAVTGRYYQGGMPAGAYNPRLQIELLEEMAKFVEAHREEITIAPQLQLEEWEKRPLPIDEVPDSEREKWIKVFPEIQLVSDQDILERFPRRPVPAGGVQGIIPTAYVRFKLCDLFNQSGLSSKEVSRPPWNKYTNPIEAFVHSVHRIEALATADLDSASMEKIWTERMAKIYQRMRPGFLGWLAASKKFGLNRLLSVFPGMDRPAESPAFEEVALHQPHLPPTETPALRFLLGQHFKKMAAEVEKAVWDFEPPHPNSKPETVGGILRRQRDRIRSFLSNRMADLMEDAATDGTFDWKVAAKEQLAKAEAQAAPFWELHQSDPEVEEYKNLFQPTQEDLLAGKPRFYFEARLEDKVKATWHSILTPQEAAQVRAKFQYADRIPLDTEAGEKEILKNRVKRFEVLQPFFSLIRQLLFKMNDPMMMAYRNSRASVDNRAIDEAQVAIVKDISKAACLFLLGADLDLVLGQLYQKILKPYQRNRRELLSLMRFDLKAEKLPEVLALPKSEVKPWIARALDVGFQGSDTMRLTIEGFLKDKDIVPRLMYLLDCYEKARPGQVDPELFKSPVTDPLKWVDFSKKLGRYYIEHRQEILAAITLPYDRSLKNH